MNSDSLAHAARRTMASTMLVAGTGLVLAMAWPLGVSGCADAPVEICSNRIDDNADGLTDEGCGCDYGGQSDGVCGTATLDSTGSCLPPARYQPSESVCDALDNDCDGETDEGCEPPPAGFVIVPPGTFRMGQRLGELGNDRDRTRVVTLRRALYAQTTEVTQGQWETLMGNNPSGFSSCGPDCPVENVNWYDAITYANALSAQEGLPPCYVLTGCTGAAGVDLDCDPFVTMNVPSGNPYDCVGYRLPTNAEWEYVYRAGTQTTFYNGELTETGCSPLDPNLDLIGWYCGNSGDQTHPVAQKAPNAWGLYDMSGNVDEWCWDSDRLEGDSPVTDPVCGDFYGFERIVRGGSWYFYSQIATSWFGYFQWTDKHFNFLGFRVVRTVPRP